MAVLPPPRLLMFTNFQPLEGTECTIVQQEASLEGERAALRATRGTGGPVSSLSGNFRYLGFNPCLDLGNSRLLPSVARL